MKRVIIVHGWGSSSKSEWIPWLKDELIKRNFEVLTPDMPETNHPRVSAWVDSLKEAAGKETEQTYFVGHSIGCQTIIRFLNETGQKIGGAVFVAGWFTLENIDDETEIAKPWLEKNIDLNKVKNLLNKSILIISDNDPYGALEENINDFKNLGSEIIILPKANHIRGEDGYNELPEALDSILKMS